MKAAYLLLLIPALLPAQTPMGSGSTPASSATSSTITGSNDLVFHFDAEVGSTPVYQNRTTYGTAGLKAESMAPYVHGSGEVIEANSSDGNRMWLHLTGTNYPSYSWFSNRNNDVWGTTLGKGRVVIERWMHSEASFTSGRLLFQINGKSGIGSMDFNDGQAIYTATIGGGSAPGLSIGIDKLQFDNPAQNTIKRIEKRWNRMIANPNGQLTEIMYVTEESTGSTTSAWANGVVPYPGGPVMHQVQAGNDTPTAFNNWIQSVKVYRDWRYDLPANLWLDMEGMSGGINTTTLAASDNYTLTGFTARTVGSMSGFSIVSGAEIASPCTINLKAETGTLGARRDMSVATGGCFGFYRFAASTVQQTACFLYRAANMATSTDAIVFFAGPQTPANYNEQYLCVRQANVAGQQVLRLFSATAGTSSSDINITAGNSYAISISYTRNTTGRLQVRNLTTGALVAAEVTLTCPNSSFGGWWIGSYSNITAQSSGVYYDIDDLCIDTSGTALWPITYWENPAL